MIFKASITIAGFSWSDDMQFSIGWSCRMDTASLWLFGRFWGQSWSFNLNSANL
jgi:hypothetical protein